MDFELGCFGMVLDGVRMLEMVVFSGHEGKGRDSVLERCGPTKQESQGGSAKGERRSAIGQGRSVCLVTGGLGLCFRGGPQLGFKGRNP